jgi:hypothetical protein
MSMLVFEIAGLSSVTSKRAITIHQARLGGCWLLPLRDSCIRESPGSRQRFIWTHSLTPIMTPETVKARSLHCMHSGVFLGATSVGCHGY